MDLLEELQKREVIYQSTNLEGLKKELSKKEISLYCGFDPTASSLHLGHLLPLVTLKRFLDNSFKVIILIGGGTALIGDPSGKKKERKLLPFQEIKEYKEKIATQIKNIFKGPENLIFVDNYQWLKEIDLIKFLREIGKDFTVSYMLSKESVKARLKIGLSFTEFAYMILQAYDFLYLAKNYNCLLQIGGSDQWGNITCGVDLIRKKMNKEAYGLTLPLVTKSDGQKFGKTEKGNIWLDKALTSPYELYQFLFNIDDKDVIKFLKYFTFLSLEEIKNLEKNLKEKPEERVAQKTLAFEIVSFIHGKKEAERARKISETLFNKGINNLKKEELEELFKTMPVIKIKGKKELDIIDFLIQTKICLSKSEARRILKEKSLLINEEQFESGETISKEKGIYNQYFLIKRGKKHYFFVLWE